jgi:hypothetical protein
MRRRDLFKGLLALAAGALLPKPLRAQPADRRIAIELQDSDFLNTYVGDFSDFRIVRTHKYDDPCVEFPCVDRVMVTERWARNSDGTCAHSYRIEDGPWIPIPPHSTCPWTFADSQISSVQRTEWVNPCEARLLPAQTSAPKYITVICPCGANNVNPCSHLLEFVNMETTSLELIDVLKRK